MTDFNSPSPEMLRDRRQALMRRRRIRNAQSIWRSAAVSAMAAGTLWLLAHPVWVLQSRSQIIVEGNQLLSDDALRALLPISYPQPLLAIEPETLIQALQTQSPVLQATVTRQLLPPRLTISVRERRPVAVTAPTLAPSSEPMPPSPAHQPGLLDAQGHWTALASFTDIDPIFALPELTVRGFKLQHQHQWPGLYQVMQAYGVEVSEVDWRVPENLILHTQMGVVHLGIYDEQSIDEQLGTLVRLRTLPDTAPSAQIEYIDLSNPKVPAVKLLSAPSDGTETDAF